MSTSHNIIEYVIYDKNGKQVGSHHQNLLCNWNNKPLLKFKPAEDYTIQAHGEYDDDEGNEIPWEDKPIKLSEFLGGVTNEDLHGDLHNKMRRRTEELFACHLRWDPANRNYTDGDHTVSSHEIETLDDDAWEKLVDQCRAWTPAVREGADEYGDIADTSSYDPPKFAVKPSIYGDTGFDFIKGNYRRALWTWNNYAGRNDIDQKPDKDALGMEETVKSTKILRFDTFVSESAGDRNESGKATDYVRHYSTTNGGKPVCGIKIFGYSSNDIDEVNCKNCKKYLSSHGKK